MNFQHLASVEAHALLDRLLHEHAAASLRHIRILREVLDAAAQEISAPGDAGPLLGAFTDRLTEAMHGEVERARQEAAAAFADLEARLEEERAKGTQLASALERAEAEVARLLAETSRLEEEARAGADAAASAAQQAAADAADAAAEIQEHRARLEQLTTVLADADRRAATLAADIETERARAEAAEDDARAKAGEATAQEAAHRAEIERLTVALAEAERLAATLTAEVQAERARAESVDQDLATTIEAHAEVEAALRAAQAEIRQIGQGRAAVDAELAASRAALDQAHAEATQLCAQIERQAETLAGLEQRLAEALHVGADRDALSTELEARRARIEALENAAAERERHAAALETRLQDAGQAGAQLLEDLTTRERALEREQDALRGARAQLDALACDHAAATERIAALEADLAAAGAGTDREALAADLEARTVRIEALEAELADLARSAGARHDELHREMDRLAALFDASARALTEMTRVTSVTELLTDLVKRLALQFSRVALFRVKGDRLVGEQQVGFDALDISAEALPISGDSLAARAFRSGALEGVTGADAPAVSLPGGAPTLTISLPVALHGVPIAIVYADDADMPEAVRSAATSETSVAFAQLLVGQTVALLVRHTHELKTLAELRDYAGTLLQEARAMYDADVAAGRTGDELRSRLKENVDYASQLYTYRAAMEGTAAAGLLDEQIAEASAGESAFARELRGVMDGCESLILNP